MKSTLPSRTRYENSTRREMLQYVPSTAQRVLDVGCNTGGFGAALKASRPVEVWGLEPDKKAASQAANQLDKVICDSLHKGVELPQASFDVVVCNDVLEHMVDPWSALRSIADLLREEGLVIASVPNFRHVENLRHVLVEGEFRYETHGIRDITHLRFFTRKSTIRLFTECGFTLLRIEGINASWWTPSLFRRSVFALLGRRVEDVKYQQFAVVARPMRSK